MAPDDDDDVSKRSIALTGFILSSSYFSHIKSIISIRFFVDPENCI